ncbi:beta-galactosidase [Fictibacillus enclensis]|uniref:beta-galactosidase n=1 Tax=Fictibacillus enclensis TaxID=1017270 RepID=UPI0025A05238|nr:beta-galactosidase [Fictibacillus enclensis]MDM5337388.1 beta-galactosidase [Fictibacillus enclensis]
MVKTLIENQINLGVCYYPEHWPEELWEDDFKRMKDLNFTYVRMGEFAWSIFEPEEGKFSFGLFERAVNKAHEYGLKIILGTPTATPPAWLTYKYPDVLNASQDGNHYQHGARRHYNYNSENYRRLSAAIVTEMAKHFKNHPAVIGWQIDNELNCEVNVFYSEADHIAFRAWAKRKYETLDNLNQAWGTVFWNQTYTSWEQVFLTRNTVSNSPNPHHMLDEKRFISDSAISFAKLQADLLRELAPNQWISTNGMFKHLDNHRMTNELLDFYAYDSYPNFGRVVEDLSEKPLRDRKWSWNLSIVRSISPNFAIFEQQSGPGGWVTRLEQPSPKPGQLRLWTYQSIAHGADMVMYFRWRTATKGTEIYWHGINDYHNLPNRRIKEVEQVSSEIQEIGEKVVGSSYKAEVAVVTNYDNEWDGEYDKWYGPFDSKSKDAWFKAFQYNHVPVDALNLNKETTLDELKKYKVLIYPHPAIVTMQQAELFKEYVKQGGKMIFGCRSGYKDETGQTYMKAFPGYLADLVGVTIEEFTRVAPHEQVPGINFKRSHHIVANDFNEVLHLHSDAEILATFTNTYFEGKPALVKRNYGSGSSFYFGGVFTIELASLLIEECNLSNYQNQFTLPEEIELAIRQKDGKEYTFLLNYSDKTQEIGVKKEFKDLLTGNKIINKVNLKPYDVMVLE